MLGPFDHAVGTAQRAQRRLPALRPDRGERRQVAGRVGIAQDLAGGREKVAERTREGIAYEKSFSEVSSLLLNHLKAKPEARDLLQELVSAMHGQSHNTPPAKTESRIP